jgi:hypothetical protein
VNSDCYAILGLSPAAEDVVIRAAYLALMRHYHPDRNLSAQAAARARAINHAYAVLGDPARRAEYDARRAGHQFAILGIAPEEEEPQPRRWRAPLVGGIAAAAIGLFVVLTVVPPAQPERPGRTREAQTLANPAPAPSVDRVRPVAEIAAQPPPLVPKNEARSLETVREIARPAPPRIEAPPRLAASPQPAQPVAERRAAASVPTPGANDAKFAALDRHSALFYSQSVGHADAAKRSLLQQARDRFVESRKECRSDSCVTDAYLGHIREVGRIMGSPEPPVP